MVLLPLARTPFLGGATDWTERPRELFEGLHVGENVGNVLGAQA